MAYDTEADIGSFISLNNYPDETILKDMEFGSTDWIAYQVQTQQYLNTIAIALNTKDTGFYALQEFICGKLYYPDATLIANATRDGYPQFRQVFRKTFYPGALPNTGTLTFAHGLSMLASSGNYLGFTVTSLYGAASDTTNQNYIPIPYVSATLGGNVGIDADATNINIVTTDDKTAFNDTKIVIEFLKN